MTHPDRSWIRMIDEADADPSLQALYAVMADPDTRRMDHVLQVHSLHPEGLQAHWALYRACMKSTPGLRKVDREMIAVVVSRINECHY